MRSPRSRNCLYSFLFLLQGMLFCLGMAACSAGQRDLLVTETVPLTPPKTSVPTLASVEKPSPPPVIATASPPAPARTKAVATPTPSPTPQALRLNFKIAYLTFKPASQDQEEEAKIWVLEPPYQAPRQVFEFSPRTGFGSQITWSTDGHRIAFFQFIKQKYVLTLLDVASLEKKEIVLNALAAGTWASIPHLWSPNDEWIATTTMTVGPGRERFETVLTNTKTSQVKRLASGTEFVDWSQVDPTQYLYLLHEYKGPFSEVSGNGKVKIMIGQIGHKDPLASIDMGWDAPRRNLHISWNPYDHQAISVSDETNIATDFFRLDFMSSDWKYIPFHHEGIANPSLWSPNGQWFTYKLGERTYLWKTNENSLESSIEIPHQNQFSGPIGWTKDSRYLIYRDGDSIYAVDPTEPQSLIPLLDLAALGITGDPQPHLSLWLPSAP